MTLWGDSTITRSGAALNDKVKCNVDSITMAITQIGDRAIRGISDVMKEEGEKIRDLARDNAPVDEGDLERAIKMEVDRSGAHGRTQVYVYVDESVTGDDGKPVEQYAKLMHEGLAPYGSGLYGDVDNPKYPDTKSKKKKAMGFDVGGKFLTRALADRYDIMMEKVRAVARRILK